MSNRPKQPKKVENDSDSDSDISACGDDEEINVGLIDDCNEDDLTEDDLKLDRILMRSPFFPSKIGGKPAWLDYKNLPLALGAGTISETNNNVKPIHLKCENCETQLVFLLQIYAPISSNDKFIDQVENIDDVFHRSLFVFICANTECSPTSKRTFKVLRSQLNRKNDFYAYEAPPEMTDSDADLKLSFSHLFNFYNNLHSKNMLNLCAVCGYSCTNKCSKCSFSFFCCRNHQVYDWTQMNHKNLCSKYADLVKSNNTEDLLKNWIDDENSNTKYPSKESVENKNGAINFFPEHEIIIEPEDLEFLRQKEKNDAKKYSKYTKEFTGEMEDLDLNENESDGKDNDFETIKENEYDKDFEKFKKRSGYEPTQVIRYDRGGKPLWCTKYSKLNESSIPNCEHCGSKRIFEFQITPQLLYYLKLDEAKQINSVDWAGLYVYTCVKNCKAALNSYANEFIYKQDFVK